VEDAAEGHGEVVGDAGKSSSARAPSALSPDGAELGGVKEPAMDFIMLSRSRQ
jgi:hypothetical protein